MNDLIDSKEYDSAMILVKLARYTPDLLQTLFAHMATNK